MGSTFEHAHQAFKYVSEMKRAHIQAIPVGPTCAADVRRAGKDEPTWPNWDSVKHIIAYRIFRCRFHQHPCLQAELLATDDKQITLVGEDRPFWTTWLPIILMCCRQELRMLKDQRESDKVNPDFAELM